MSIYSRALDAYLDKSREGSPTQAEFADRVGCTQAAISRYAAGVRFPPREIAERIELESAGQVSLEDWRIVATERAGLAA